MAKYVFYSRPESAECDLMRSYLTNRNIDFEERDITDKTNGIAYKMEINNLGYYHPPVLLKEFEEEDHTNALKRTTIVGFNIEALDKMLDYIV